MRERETFIAGALDLLKRHSGYSLLSWAKAEVDSLHKTCISQTFSAQCPEEKKVLKHKEEEEEKVEEVCSQSRLLESNTLVAGARIAIVLKTGLFALSFGGWGWTPRAHSWNVTLEVWVRFPIVTCQRYA